jgi:hypothetical protein
VLVAQSATLQSRDPGAKLHSGLNDQGMTGVAGNPRHFHAEQRRPTRDTPTTQMVGGSVRSAV